MGKNLLKAIALSSLVLSGCAPEKKINPQDLGIEQFEKGPEMVDYVAEMNLWAYTSPLGVTFADVNEDGHLDMIVSGYESSSGKIKVYEGDGKGNFKLRQYEKKK